MDYSAKCLGVLLTVLLFASINAIQPTNAKADSPKTIVVPDEYEDIQTAINHANVGDTVFVKNGNYAYSPILNQATKLYPAGYYGYEIIINKSISLIGEDSQETIITPIEHSGMPQITPIRIEAVNVKIAGFTIRDAYNGITFGSSDCQVVLNNIVNISNSGIDAWYFNNAISQNNITGATYGIHGNMVDSTISENNITSNDEGIVILGSYTQPSSNITISQNSVVNNKNYGIAIDNTINTCIYGNNISGNSKGLGLGDICRNPQIYNNYIAQNNIGVSFYSIVKERIATGYEFYSNDFVANNKTVEIPQSLDSGSWDNGTMGNYWSDYQSKYPFAIEIDDSGIGNTPYVIDQNNTDNFPLIKPVENLTPNVSVPELSWLVILPLLLSVFSIAGLHRCWRQVKKV
jgi:hypothetical protein